MVLNKKILLLLIVGIFLISLVSATTLGTFRQDDCVNLIQICDDCSYNNISAILFPNSTTAIINIAMDRDDTYYNYSFCMTNTIGNYIINGYGDLGGVKTSWNYNFEITPSGEESPGSGEGIIFLASIISMILVTFLFFSLSFILKNDSALRFGFIGISLVCGLMVVLYSSVALMEVNSGFTRILNSFSIFQYVILAVLFIIFIFVLIAVTVKALDNLNATRGLKAE